MITQDQPDNLEDYTAQLAEDESARITCGLFSIHLKRNNTGISLDIYALGAEDCEPLASAQAWDNDAADAAGGAQ